MANVLAGLSESAAVLVSVVAAVSFVFEQPINPSAALIAAPNRLKRKVVAKVILLGLIG
jgi:mevalonate kinase